MNANTKYMWNTIKRIYVEDHGAVFDMVGNHCS